MDILKQVQELRNEIERLKNTNTQIVYCNNCKTYVEDLAGAREPDFEGYCPKCGERSNWEVIDVCGVGELVELLNGVSGRGE